MEAIKSNETKELEQAMAEAEAKEAVLERQAAVRNVRSVQQFKQVLVDSGLETKSLNAATLLEVMRKEPKFTVEQADDGSLHVQIDGKDVRLKTAIHMLSDEHADLFKQSYSELIKKTVRSREDFITEADKVDFISRFGYQAFAELPVSPVKEPSLDTMTREQYRALPASRKLEIIAQIHPSGIETIMARRSDPLSASGVQQFGPQPERRRSGVTIYPRREQK